MEDQEPGRPGGWERLIAPFRSEDAAFRMVLWVLAVCIAVAAIALIIRAAT